MKTQLLAAALVVASVSVAPALAADGQQLFTDKGCTACHGEDAKTPLDVGYPRLAGQNADYMFNQLKDIKSGARANALSAETMKPILEDVSEADMRTMVDWLATLPRPSQVNADLPGKKLYMTKTCVACHGKDGMKPIMKTYPFIAGQEKQYLINQMADIKTANRKNGNAGAMTTVMHLVSEQELADIADFLANVK